MSALGRRLLPGFSTLGHVCQFSCLCCMFLCLFVLFVFSCLGRSVDLCVVMILPQVHLRVLKGKFKLKKENEAKEQNW